MAPRCDMFFPYSDENPTRSFPLFTVILILANCAIYYMEVYGQPAFEQLINSYALAPCNVNTLHLNNYRYYVPFISHMFLHVNIIHVAGNMLFLWIFGNNVEDVLGGIRFYAFYVLCGIAAAVTFFLFHHNECTPIIGASGAVSGVLGGYVVLFPSARIKVWFIFFVLRLRAWFFILLWFLLQLSNLYGEQSGVSNVAWSAHVGGFIAGFVLIMFFKKRK
ncbi:MAG TPA: rhomboid family intramembrane serine protease [Spirochaetota bacterium]|nr:rhomboid family intramembrane serine protease [Spirochaetota bacterium]